MKLEPLDPDEVDRTALLGVHLGTQPTLEASLQNQRGTGLIVCADRYASTDPLGQAALLTAVLTGVRAFGTVLVECALEQVTIATGPFRDRRLGDVLVEQGATLSGDIDSVPPVWPIVLIGPTSTPSTGTNNRIVLRSTWQGWIARVTPSAAPLIQTSPPCVLAAIGAAALAVSEAFGAVLGRPGRDSGFRSISLNLWRPGSTEDHGPKLAHAPQAWWLVGLGHLGQAYAWVISNLQYANPVEVVLQDTDATVPANHSTGIFTPVGSRGTLKTRMTMSVLEDARFTTRLIERRLDESLRAQPSEAHVALLGVDNLPARRLISEVGWVFAIDVGLGSGAKNYDSLLLRRFPGDLPSDQIAAWAQEAPTEIAVPSSPAFQHLQDNFEACGVVELAGKAVGASFVGVVAAVLAVAEATKELHGGRGLDVLSVNLGADQIQLAETERPADVISVELRG
jgi:hypothetical protein